MKILFLCADTGVPVLGGKGAAVHVRAMADAFCHAGHEVILAAPQLNKSPWESPAPISARVLHLPPSSWPRTAVAAVRAFSEKIAGPDALAGELRRILINQELEDELIRRFDRDPPAFIYERASLFGVAGASVARAFGIPLLLEVNAPLALEQSTYRGHSLAELAGHAERWTLAQADSVLPVSAALREHVLSLGVAPERVQVVPNGVNLDLFQPGPADPQLRRRLGLGDGPVLGFVGGLRPWHGVEVLPELLARLTSRHPKLQLLVVGDGQLRSELERSLRERGLSQQAILTGAIAHEQVGAMIRLFDVALAPYPALDHPFYFSPLKLFEYMACGIAVVSADGGQEGELVRHEDTGLLCPAGDVQAMATACDRLLTEPKLRHVLGQQGAQLVRAHFTWDRNAARVLELARRARANTPAAEVE